MNQYSISELKRKGIPPPVSANPPKKDHRNANDRDKSIVDTILKPEVRAQSEAVEETPLSTTSSHSHHSIQESAS